MRLSPIRKTNSVHGDFQLESGDDGAPARARWIKTNQGVAVCIAGVVVVLLIYLGTSEWAYQKLRDGFRLGFFSAVAAVAMLACAVLMMVDRQRSETDPDMARSGWLDWIVTAAVMAICYLYFELAWRLDFLLVSPFFIAGGTYALGVRPVRAAIVAGVVITVVIYVLFRLIGIELPTRIVWF